MKFSTAVARLDALAADMTRDALAWDEESLLVEAYVYGDLLAGPEQLEWVSVALVMDLPVEEVTWLSRPGPAEAVACALRLDKLPISRRYRPAVWPVWNHEITRAARFWSKEHGTDNRTIGALKDHRFDDLAVVTPPDTETLAEQLGVLPMDLVDAERPQMM